METKDSKKPQVSDTRWARSLAMIAWLVVVVIFSIFYLITRDGLRFTFWSGFWLAALAAMIGVAGIAYFRKSKPEYTEPEKADGDGRVAILVVHGMGVQDRFQMLDDFARSMPVYTQAYSGKVSLLGGAPKNEYLPLKVGEKQVDVHEAYWGFLFNRLATLPKTLVFGAWTLGKFAPMLFSRFWKKRLAEALYVGLALGLLYAAISSVYSGLVMSSQRFEAVQLLKEGKAKLSPEQAAVLEGATTDPDTSQNIAPALQGGGEERKQPTWRERVDLTSTFAWHAVVRGLSTEAWSGMIAFEKPKKLLLNAPRDQLIYSLLYCVSFGLIWLSVFRLLFAQLKYWTAGRNGPKDNAEYEKAVNEKWAKDSWGAIKSGMLPLTGTLVLDPILDPMLVHLVATLAVLVLVLKGLSWWVTNYLGDVMIYATLNANAETHEAREKSTVLVASRLRSLLEDARYQRVIVVAHSLGTVIATNAVRRVHNAGHEQFGKLGAFVTIGSPLRKFRQLFKAQPYLWAFGDNAIARDSDIFIGEEYHHKKRVPWFNYWYGSDVFADRLAYEPRGKLKEELIKAANAKSQDDYADAVVKAYKTSYDELDNTGFRVGDRRDCNLGPRPGVWTHSDYWLDHRFVDDVLLMTQCDDTVLKSMSVALKPTIDANKRP